MERSPLRFGDLVNCVVQIRPQLASIFFLQFNIKSVLWAVSDQCWAVKKDYSITKKSKKKSDSENKIQQLIKAIIFVYNIIYLLNIDVISIQTKMERKRDKNKIYDAH